MFFFENVRLALASLRANKMRSILTMLGIIIGISAVITITTLGNSLKKTLANSFTKLGGQTFYVEYRSKHTDDPEEEIDMDYRPLEDADRINEVCSGEWREFKDS